MTEFIQPARVITAGSAFAPSNVAAAAAACLSLALVLAGRAESSTTQTNAVAAYDDGSVTAGDIAEYVGEPHFLADADQNAPSNVAVTPDEKLARHLAATRIMVKAARQKGWAGPGWPLEAKLIEQGVLAQALADEMRRGVLVSDQEVSEQYATNRFKLLGFQTIEAGRIGISAKKHGDKTLERAKEALALIRGGQDFAAVGRQYSDLELRLTQKELYSADFWGKPDSIAIAELGEGKVSDPLPVPDGFELVKVERIYLKGNPSPEEAKVNLRAMLNDTAAAERLGEMERAASAAFPLQAAETTTSPSTNAVLLRCGLLTLTKDDIRGLAAQRGTPDLENQKLIEIIKQENGYRMQMGELARSMGFDKRPDVQKALRYELDRQLAAKARAGLLPELAAGLTFEEERIRKAYDETFKATFDPLLQYDLLLVPMGAPPNATAEAREAARTNAQAKAQALIRRVQDGSSFDTLAGAEAGAQLMRGQSRTVREGSALAPLVAGLKAGEIAAEPCEDFGGYCVLRVNKYEPRRKMPYELARNYIVEDFRTEALGELRKNFESVLLGKYHFTFGPAAMARTRDSGSAPRGKTNNPQ